MCLFFDLAFVTDVQNPMVYRSQAVSLSATGSISSCAGVADGNALQYLWYLQAMTYDSSVVDASYVTSLPGTSAARLLTTSPLGSSVVPLSSYVTNDPTALKVAAGVLQPGVTYSIVVCARMKSRPSVSVSGIDVLDVNGDCKRLPFKVVGCPFILLPVDLCGAEHGDCERHCDLVWSDCSHK